MRLFEAPSTLLSLVAFLLASPAGAGPFSRLSDLVQQQVGQHHDDHLSLQNATLEARGDGGTCAAGSFSCGYYKQLCCLTGSQTCATNAQNQAYCADSGAVATAAAATGNGAWQLYTSTWVTTGLITMTSVYSSWVPAATATGAATGATCTPNWANSESSCGPICCSSGQYCFDANSGICKPAGNGGYTTTGVSYSAPLRPTTSNGVIITATISPTTTVPFQTPVVTGAMTGNGTVVASHSGLSGGAIAGIVIGVIAGLILLILICLFCCLKAGFDGLLALIGMGKRRDRRRTRVEEEYVETHRRYGSAGQGSERRWYGSGGTRPARPPPPPSERRKQSGGIGNLGALGLGLGGLAVALGLKRRHDRREEEKSDYSSNYDSYYYSESSTGGDDRTHRSSRR